MNPGVDPAGRSPRDDGRPALHLTPPSGWLNDPHGVVHRDGVYHLFHQAVPDRPSWAPEISWGHATSTDLLRWEHQGTALVPAPDETGCWTGTLVLDADGKAVILYSSTRGPDLERAAVRTAVPDSDDWRRWTSGDRVHLPLDDVTRERIAVFRDPSVRREGSGWRMVVGAGFTDGSPVVLTWLSDDLATWTYAGELAVGVPRNDGPWLGTAWECPHLVEVDGHEVLLTNSWMDGITGEALAAVGRLEDGRFVNSRWTQISHGGGHYAATVFRDAEDAPCVIFWIRGVADLDAGWSGALSIPYRLGVVDGSLRLSPHPDVVAAAGAAAAEDGLVLVDIDALSGTPHGQVEVTTGRDEVIVNVGATHVRLPAHYGEAVGDLTVILDGPVLEVCTGAAVAGSQLSR
ncbi:glycoside hydrolase family 32 protein [Oryzobacter sp. R7]|uniref:glycoside hydrolase family 32 protein n=1 Tax=Oryzobacter faecalis TaxID=3388656 RepID=UPI00398CB5CB